MWTLVHNLLSALVLTILIEGIVMIVWKRRWLWVRYSVLCNIGTNPLLNCILMAISPHVSQLGRTVSVAIGEVSVVLIEALWYYRMTGSRYRKCLVMSLVLNGASFFLGQLVSEFIW